MLDRGGPGSVAARDNHVEPRVRRISVGFTSSRSLGKFKSASLMGDRLANQQQGDLFIIPIKGEPQ